MNDRATRESTFPSLSDLEDAARKKVPSRVWAYIQGGSGEERTVRFNREAFDGYALLPRVLTDVSELHLKTRMLGQEISAPLFIAPMAYQHEVHPEGELGVARAAGSELVLAIYSTLSSYSLEEVADASSGPRWFQLYLQPEVEESIALVERAERAGYSAIVLTVDCPILGVRDRQAREGFAIDETMPVGNGDRIVPPSRVAQPEAGVFRLRKDAAATWRVLEQLEKTTSLPFVVKGILTAEDARLAVAHGAKAIVVSNHGGRQLDGVPAAIEVLPEIVRAVHGRAEVYLDSGVRRGSDVLTALALGARAVGIGRPVLWALAVDGGRGVARYLELLKAELANAMALAGRRTPTDVDGSLVRVRGGVADLARARRSGGSANRRTKPRP